jgi:hypothetical protein
MQTTGEDSFRHNFESGRCTDAPFVACLISDQSPRFFAHKLCEPTSGGTCGQTSRFEHHDASAVEPREVEESKGKKSGLAGAGWCDEYAGGSFGERRADVVDDVFDGQIGARYERNQNRLRPRPGCRGTTPDRRVRGSTAPTTTWCRRSTWRRSATAWRPNLRRRPARSRRSVRRRRRAET